MSTGDVFDQIHARVGREELSNAAAVTIASWYQSPGTEGRAFAALASGAPTNTGALLNDLSTAYKYVQDKSPESLALDMLGTWILSFTE
jgi:hypothetical protein